VSVGRIILVVGLCGVVAALACGCGSNASFPFERDVVWRAAVGEAIVWRPNYIDDKTYTISGGVKDVNGREVQYDIEVYLDPNPFVYRPSTRVFVFAKLIQPTLPREQRLADMEREFLTRLGQRLQEEYPQSVSPP